MVRVGTDAGSASTAARKGSLWAGGGWWWCMRGAGSAVEEQRMQNSVLISRFETLVPRLSPLASSRLVSLAWS